MFKKYDAYLVGYYGMKNSGDDALMYASTYAAKEILNCQNLNIGLFGDHTREINADTCTELRFSQDYRGQNRLLQYKGALQSKRVIFGGGSVLHSENDINLKRHLMSLSDPKKSLAVGVGLGPFQDIKAEKSCAKFLNECGFIGVRDNESLAIANSLAPTANVHKTFDLAPLLLASPDINTAQKERKGIALSLCSVAVNPMGEVSSKDEQKRIDYLAKLITSIYENTGEPITLIEFNGHSHLGDWFVNNSVLAKVNKYIPVKIEKYEPNPIELLNNLSTYKVVISMRLHGSILAYLANTPVISINYHKKCKGWCEDIGMYNKYRIELGELNINHIVTQITDGLSTGFMNPTLSINEAYQQTLSNWSTHHE